MRPVPRSARRYSAMFAATLADAFDLDRLYNYAVERALDGVAARIATRQPIKP